LCCKLLGVTELNKPKGVWCQHCDKGHNCKIYDDRPQSCRNFECGWLLSDLPVAYRPDKLHLVITGESKELDAMVIHVDPAYPDAYRQPKAEAVLQAVVKASRKGIVLIIGNRRHLLTNDPRIHTKVQTALDKLDDEKIDSN
jgi:hypothetical protein